MKIDTSRLKRGTSEVPIECQQLIDRLSTCSKQELIAELSKIDSWIFGKCELYHWISILDKFDMILEEATQNDGENEWSLKCDTNFSQEDIKLLLLVLNFTTLLIEHSFSRHLYNSIEHLTKLFSSSNMNIILSVLNLLYMFSKRSNFISRLTNNKKNSLLARLNFLAESWGGKEYGFSLAACCKKSELPETASTLFFEFYSNNGTLKTIEYEDITANFDSVKTVDELARNIFIVHKADIKDLDEDQKIHMLIRIRRAWAFRLYSERLHFVQARLQALSVLIYSNSVQENIHQLLYPGLLEELVKLMGLTNPNLVEIKAAALRTLTSIIHLDRNPHFPKKPGSRLVMIIDVTGASSYHGFLPTLVRTCINSLTSFNSNISGQLQELRLNQSQINNNSTFYLRNYSLEHHFPLPLATALFSFLYHLASYEAGGEALVSCGMMESLLRIINWNGYELEHITFVTRAVRVIDLITNIEMNSFQNFGGLESFINRLDLEVNYCRKEQPFEIEPQQHSNSVNDINDFTGLFSNSNSSNNSNSDRNARSSLLTTFSNILRPNDLEINGPRSRETSQETRISQPLSNVSLANNTVNTANDFVTIDDTTNENSYSPIHRLLQHDELQPQQQDLQRVRQYQRVRCIPGINSNASTLVCEIINDFNSLIDDQSSSENKKSTTARLSAKTCLPQRAALLKSMLNFLKKAIQDQTFSDNIRHLMEGTLPSSLRHIISNAEYYGSSLFLLATDVVTVYVFQEPSLLSSLQDNGLTDVVLQALLKKDVPATREVLGSLPNVFSALCLNSRGLHAFVKYAPFERLYKVLLSPLYLLAMRRRRSNEPMGDTASNLGNAMDELMRHQPSLKSEATKAIIKLLNELVHLGTNSKYICWKPNNKTDPQSMSFTNISSNSTNQSSGIVNNSCSNNSNISSTTSILRQQPPQNHRPNTTASSGSLTINVNINEADMSDGDDDDDDEEEASTSSHHNQREERLDSVSNQSSGTTSNSICNNIHNTQSIIMNQTNSGDKMITDDSSSEQREPIPLIDYILNAMKFVDAILSNNSTDDHCREFVQHGGLQPLLSILALPNLPVDSPVTTSAQAVAAVCKSILNLSHESEVLQVALNQLSVIVDKLHPLQVHIENPGGSVLLRELANCPNVDAAFSNASYTPLLHAMSAVHGYIIMLVHVCRTGQSEIRTILLEKWGQKNQLLTNLVQLYTALVWESTLLLALCTDDVFPSECDFSKEDIEKLPSESLKENNQGFSNILNNQKHFDDNIAKEVKDTQTVGFNSSASGINIGNENGSFQINNKNKLIVSPGQLKYIKALLGASSRLGRALAELFGNLVKLCVGSPLRQRRGQNYPPTQAYTSEEAKDIARVLSYILVDGFSYEKLSPSPIPKLKLTFLICSVGFTGPMLFDEKRYAFHLMLYQFVKEGGLKAFFQMFEWALSPKNVENKYTSNKKNETKNATKTDDSEISFNHKFPDGTGEFLDAWLMLLEKMVNPKAILESPHVINPSAISQQSESTLNNTSSNRGTRNANETTGTILSNNGNYNYCTYHSTSSEKCKKVRKFEFDPILYLVTIHRLAFDAVVKIWGMKPLQIYGIRMTESMMSILKHIIKGEKSVKEKYKKRIAEIRETDRVVKLQYNSDYPSSLIVTNNGSDSFSSHLQTVSTMSTQTNTTTSDNVLDTVFNRIRPQQIENNIDQCNSSNMTINQEHLRQLMDMGFSEERATTALLLTVSVQDATEYLLNHPPSPPPISIQSVSHQQSQMSEQQPSEISEQNQEICREEEQSEECIREQERQISSTENKVHGQEIKPVEVSDKENQDHINKNGLINQPQPTASTAKQKSKKKMENKQKNTTDKMKRNKTKRKFQITTNPPLKESRIDEFCDTAIEKAIFLMDELPETVSKGTDLLVILYRRNRSEWRQYFLIKIVKELNCWIDFIRKQIRLSDTNVRVMLYGEGAQKFYVRLQLCCLLMDDIYPDMRESICNTINEHFTLSKLLCLLSEVEELLRIKTCELRAEYRRKALLALSVIVIGDDENENQHHTSKKDVKMLKPKWLAQMITFIDLVEKVNLSIQRKTNMLNVTTRTWKWYDINLGRWNTYSAVNNKIIDQSYEKGEASVPITSGRQRYTINFNCMSQVNDESGNHRPVILSLKAVEKYLHPQQQHQQQQHQQEQPQQQQQQQNACTIGLQSTTPSASFQSHPSTSLHPFNSSSTAISAGRFLRQVNVTNSNTGIFTASMNNSCSSSALGKPSLFPLIVSSDDSECDENEEGDSDSEDYELSNDEINYDKYSSLSEGENYIQRKPIDLNNIKITPPSAEGILYDNSSPLPGRERIYESSKSVNQENNNLNINSQHDILSNPSDIKIDCTPVGLFQYDTGEIVCCLVRLLQPEIDVDRDTFLAIMKLCVRLTKKFSNAKIFALEGGVRLLLGMRQTCGYMGFPIFATLLIRHVLEEPKTLGLAMEKVIAARTMPTIPPGYRDLLFLLRQMSSAVSRDPDIFREVAQKMLRIDLLSPRLVKPDDTRLLVKSILPQWFQFNSPGGNSVLSSLSSSSSVNSSNNCPSTSNSPSNQYGLTSNRRSYGNNEQQSMMEPVSVEAVHDLLKALVQPIKCDPKYKIRNQTDESAPSTSYNLPLTSVGNRIIQQRSCVLPTLQASSTSTSLSSTTNCENNLPSIQINFENIRDSEQLQLLQQQQITVIPQPASFEQLQEQPQPDLQSPSQAQQQTQNDKPNSTVHNCNEQCRFWHMPVTSQSDKPLLPRATILKFLADAVRSYQTFAPLIVEHQYHPKDSVLIKTPQSVLSYILDKFLPLGEHTVDREVSSMTRVLIAALASCSDQINVQTIVVCEVKLAINKVLSQPESADKHLHLQILSSLIPTMIENCPPENHTLLKLHQMQPRRNEIFYIMVRKGLISDLAKLTLYLDLSSPHTIGTINATLKPLETLLRMTNAPSPISFFSKKPYNRRIFCNNDEHHPAHRSSNLITEDVNDVHPERRPFVNNDSGVSNNYPHRHILRNQNDMMGENVEELQATAENLVRPPERGQAHLDDIMDQLLEHASNIENDSTQMVSGNHSQATVRRVIHEFFDESSTESGDSDSNGSENDERGIDEDDDNEEEGEDRSEIDVDEETRQFIEIYDHVYNRHLSSSGGTVNTANQLNSQEIRNEVLESNSSDAITDNVTINQETVEHIETTEDPPIIVPIQGSNVNSIEPELVDDGNDSTSSESVFYSSVLRSTSDRTDLRANPAINIDDFDDILSVDSTDIGIQQSNDISIRQQGINSSRHPEVVAESVVADVVANVVAALESSSGIDVASAGGSSGNIEGTNRSLINLQATTSHSSQLSHNIRRRRRRPIQFSFAINSSLAPVSDFLNLRRRRCTLLNENVDHTPIILQQLLGPSNSGTSHTPGISENGGNISNINRSISISAALGNVDSNETGSGGQSSPNGSLLSQFNINPFATENTADNLNAHGNTDTSSITTGNIDSGVRRNSNSSTSNIFRDATRVVLMDNAFGLFPDENFPDDRSIDLVDQAGYLFGQSLAATLASTPTALHWWLEESKNLGLESQSDVCLTVGHQLIPILELQREAELARLRNKKKRKEDSKTSTSTTNNLQSSEGQVENLQGVTSTPFVIPNTETFRSSSQPGPSMLCDQHRTQRRLLQQTGNTSQVNQLETLSTVPRFGSHPNFGSQSINVQTSQFVNSGLAQNNCGAFEGVTVTSDEIFRTPSLLHSQCRSNVEVSSSSSHNSVAEPSITTSLNANLRTSSDVVMNSDNHNQRSRRNRAWMINRVNDREHVLTVSNTGLDFFENAPHEDDSVNIMREEPRLRQTISSAEQTLNSHLDMPVLSSLDGNERRILSNVNLEMPRLVPILAYEDGEDDDDVEIVEDIADEHEDEEEEQEEEDEEEVDETEAEDEYEADEQRNIINHVNQVVHSSVEAEEPSDTKIIHDDDAAAQSRTQSTQNAISGSEITSLPNSSTSRNNENAANIIGKSILNDNNEGNNLDDLDEILEIIDRSRESENNSTSSTLHPTNCVFLQTLSEIAQNTSVDREVVSSNNLSSKVINISDNSSSSNEVTKQENDETSCVSMKDSPSTSTCNASIMSTIAISEALSSGISNSSENNSNLTIKVCENVEKIINSDVDEISGSNESISAIDDTVSSIANNGTCISTTTHITTATNTTSTSSVVNTASSLNAEGVTVFSNNRLEMSSEILETLGDLEIPEGVDPSFVAALPQEMREEVIAEHLRLQRLRQRAQQISIQVEHAAVAEVNPEFLAALPPNIQEEVLAQQRIEQQRQAAAAANPNDPVDAAAFFQNLPPNLRQAILTDMEDSQISVLPPELAAEAQNLRRDWETRNRQIIHERLINQIGSSSPSNTNMLNLYRSPRYPFMHNVRLTQNWQTTGENRVYSGSSGVSLNNSQGSIGDPTNSSPSLMTIMERQGKPLLDHEALASLLIVLFIDDPKFNTLRLHRVIRNLCCHVPTREWIINALLSVIVKTQESYYVGTLLHAKSQGKPNWLNIRSNAALGSRANVFTIEDSKLYNELFIETSSSSKKRFTEWLIATQENSRINEALLMFHNSRKSCNINRKKSQINDQSNYEINRFQIAIHPQAAQIVCKHAIELLITLAKSFPKNFLPYRKQDKAMFQQQQQSEENEKVYPGTKQPESQGQTQRKQEDSEEEQQQPEENEKLQWCEHQILEKPNTSVKNQKMEENEEEHTLNLKEAIDKKQQNLEKDEEQQQQKYNEQELQKNEKVNEGDEQQPKLHDSKNQQWKIEKDEQQQQSEVTQQQPEDREKIEGLEQQDQQRKRLSHKLSVLQCDSKPIKLMLINKNNITIGNPTGNLNFNWYDSKAANTSKYERIIKSNAYLALTSINIETDFWDIILNLDRNIPSKYASYTFTPNYQHKIFSSSQMQTQPNCSNIPSISKQTQLNFTTTDSKNTSPTFDQSPFGTLVSMLSYRIINKSSHLTDKLLRLLSFISVVLPNASQHQQIQYMNQSQTTIPLQQQQGQQSQINQEQKQNQSGNIESRSTMQHDFETNHLNKIHQSSTVNLHRETFQILHKNCIHHNDFNSTYKVNIKRECLHAYILLHSHVKESAGVQKQNLSNLPLLPPYSTEDFYDTFLPKPERLALILETLVDKNCSEEGLEDATSLLLNLSQCCRDTRAIIFRLLIDAANILGRRVDQQIRCLLNELREMNLSQLQNNQQRQSQKRFFNLIHQIPSTSTACETSPDQESLISNHQSVSNINAGIIGVKSKGMLQDRFTRETVVITAPTKMKQSTDLQLTSMIPLISKTSAQAIFLRFLKTIIQIRENMIEEHNKIVGNLMKEPQTFQSNISNIHSEQQQTKEQEKYTEVEQENRQQLQEEPKNNEYKESEKLEQKQQSEQQKQSHFSKVRYKTVIELINPYAYEMSSLSELLLLDNLWDTLSDCLIELELSSDYHAVLVLQSAVESFFLVHATPQKKKKQTSLENDTQSNVTLQNPFTFQQLSSQQHPFLRQQHQEQQQRQQEDHEQQQQQRQDQEQQQQHEENERESTPLLKESEDKQKSETKVHEEQQQPILGEKEDERNCQTKENEEQQYEQHEVRREHQQQKLEEQQNSEEKPQECRDQQELEEGEEKQCQKQQKLVEKNEDEAERQQKLEEDKDLQQWQSDGEDDEEYPQPTLQNNDQLPTIQLIETDELEIHHTYQCKLTVEQRKFLQFAEKHRTVLNQILRQSTGHLSDGPFAVLVDHTRILDFDVKRRYFRTELERLDEGIRREEIAVHVNRKTVFEDSFRELYRRNAEEWKNRFYIVFEDEEGQDAGGLLREWYVIISREIFNPMYALFTVSPGDRVTYMINSSSHANPNHLCYYKFVGRVIAKAIYDNKLLECYFTRSFYKHILGIQVKYTDMESEDYEFYKSLIFLLEHEVSALGYDLTFSLEVQEFGVTEVKDLIANGRNVFVTDDNKLEYIRLVCQLKMSNSIKQQLNAFLEGFYDIIPKRLISIFNEQELELLISGLPNVDIEDLRANTEYHKYQINSIQIQWFWRALRSFDQAERAKFLQFVTGTSKVPLNGFGSLEGMNGIQKFQIHRDDRSTDRLPSAHTCFNQLDLPVYKTYDKLRSSLLKAIHECSEGFGFA